MPGWDAKKITEVFEYFTRLAGVGKVTNQGVQVFIELPFKVEGRTVKVIIESIDGSMYVNGNIVLGWGKLNIGKDIRYYICDKDGKNFVGLRVYTNIDYGLVRVYGSNIKPMEYIIDEPGVLVNSTLVGVEDDNELTIFIWVDDCKDILGRWES